MEGIETRWDLALPLATIAGLADVAGVLAHAGVNIDSACCAGIQRR